MLHVTARLHKSIVGMLDALGVEVRSHLIVQVLKK